MRQQLLRLDVIRNYSRQRLSQAIAFICFLVMLGSSQLVIAQCPITQIPTYSSLCSSGDYINSFTLAGTPATSMAGCNGQTSNYMSYSSPVWNLTLGTSYSFSYTTGSWSQGLGIWIDLNNNGIYDSNERVGTCGSTTSGSGTITIPTTAVAGSMRRMRVRCAYATTPATTAACTNFSFGETADFYVNLISPTTCSGFPTAGSITTTGGTTFCGSGSPTFTVSGYSTSGGISLQWQYSTNGGTTWNNYTGGTSSSYAPGAITTNTMVQCAVYCSYSGLTAYTSPVTITVNPNPTISTTTANPVVCGTSGTASLSVSGTGTSYSWAPSTGLSSTTGSSVTATVSSTMVYTVTSTLGTCTSTMSIPVNLVADPPTLTTATPSAVCSGSSTQLATSQAPTNYEIYRVSPALQTLTAPQSPSFTSLDDGYATVSLPFNFTFYGNSYSTLYIGTNGYVGFSTTSMTSLSAQTLPSSTAPNNLIALFWHDMNLNNGGTVTYSTEGVTPNMKFIISYNNVKDYSSGASSNNNGQIILYETSNIIDVLVDYTNNTSVGYSRTLGVENSSGTTAATPTGRNNSTWTINNPANAEGYRFVWPSYTYAWTPSTNLNNASAYNPVASNNTSATTFNVTVTNDYPQCSTIDSVAITINPLPTATITASPTTICDGQTTTISMAGTNDAQLYFSEAGVSQGMYILTGGSNSWTSSPLSTTTVYTLDSIISTQGCKSTPATTATVTVNPRPTASMSGSTTVCNGTPAYLMVNVGQGSAPWTVTYTDGSNSYTETSSNTSFAIQVTPNTTTTYSLTGMVDALCNSVPADLTGSATITVNPRPTATLSVPAATICNGVVQNLNVALTGTPPYNFDVYDGTSYTSYTNITTNSFDIPLNISSTTSYSITSLTDANCVGWLQDYGMPVTVVVNPRPTGVITGSDVICNGNSTSAMNVTLTGSAPWNFNYFDGNTTVSVNNVMSSPHTLTIAPNVTATYTLTSVTDANNCSAWGIDMSGSGNVVVNYAPNILSQSGNVSACAGDNAIFAVNATGTNLVYQWTENGTPINNGGVYSGANTPILNISDITGLDGNVYVLQVSGICPPAISSTPLTLTASTHNQWTGTADANWSNPANWSCGILPTAATDVTITPSAPHQPKVDIPNAICKGLLIYPGSSVEIVGTNNALEVKADIVNLGQFDADGGKLIVSGNGPQNVPGVIYKHFEVQGGSIKTFSGNAVVTGMLNLFSGYIELGINNLTLGEQSTLNGGGPSSFVVTNGSGKVVGENMGLGANMGTVTFPVGSNTNSYTPVMISNSGMADDINVRVIDGVWEDYNGNTGIGTPLTSDAVNKTWLIHETIPGGSNATITPQWNFAEHMTNFNPANCAVSHYIQTDNEWVPGPLSPATGFSPYTQTLTGVTSFSPFGVSSAGPLGLELLSFKGNLVGEDALLNWLTTSEVDMKGYDVERSLDRGVTYTKVGTVAATGNGKVGDNNYNYVDASVTTLGVDRILYRLKLVNKAGKYSYSNVVTVTPGKATVKGNIDLYPNPVSGTDLYIRMGETSTNEAITVQVTDMSGRVLSAKDYAAGSYNAEAVKVNVSDLAPGIYMVRIVGANNTTIETLKFNRQ